MRRRGGGERHPPHVLPTCRDFCRMLEVSLHKAARETGASNAHLLLPAEERCDALFSFSLVGRFEPERRGTTQKSSQIHDCVFSRFAFGGGGGLPIKYQVRFGEGGLPFSFVGVDAGPHGSAEAVVVRLDPLSKKDKKKRQKNRKSRRVM